ncbi:TMAO reductase system periplasmic protein TorT [Castellaniella sp.]|uniref:TMAO reductase system periplasmic protein TorT n=1 Tax=Castellaniella sp. TaxID=1955812 RepID=UPI003563EEDE
MQPNKFKITILAVSLFMGLNVAAHAETNWSAPANFTADGTTTEGVYEPIATDKITKEWKICALFPDMHHAYWLAANYGIISEAERDKVQLDMFQANGYTNLDKQMAQMDNCITQQYDAIILGAISDQGTWAGIHRAKRAGIPVIDFVNGVTSEDISAHARVSFHDLAVQTAKYLIDHSDGEKIKVGFFPGPEGANWSDQAVIGFNKTIEGTNVEVIVTRRADTELNTQLNLIQDALLAYPDMNAIVGVDVAGAAGSVAVRNLKKADSVKVYAFDIDPQVYENILNGTAVASPTDFTVIQGKMAVDLAVRLLEGETLKAKMVGPIPEVIDIKNAKTVPHDDMFAPSNFSATYSYAPAK